jgi:hypothetical protein
VINSGEGTNKSAYKKIKSWFLYLKKKLPIDITGENLGDCYIDKAFLISSNISSGCSKPTDKRINPGVIPTAFLSSSVNLECVVLAG